MDAFLLAVISAIGNLTKDQLDELRPWLDRFYQENVTDKVNTGG